ncbi:hypothetical protein TTHERM_000463218 (macronuclear) [Tetrahymena thermophila SB210]|uniref:Uncharacterized protein n=1 Tax=Tetrahymena thermophila (strain SB210) TaxID=312017 RepID=W7XBA1_TETTS|nr:hypothetical protein TTHERM_000463218 [Tetrahymena thermophila SB210]EWS73703.1 hypothetical protein TTHERM_000463218 [Tetrahymena thermophila SB210]|eukprot:XP_012653741.1 hypothetical protein TTHERM_000463218 [Tetrahymena thermophila SB210]
MLNSKNLKYDQEFDAARKPISKRRVKTSDYLMVRQQQQNIQEQIKMFLQRLMRTEIRSLKNIKQLIDIFPLKMQRKHILQKFFKLYQMKEKIYQKLKLQIKDRQIKALFTLIIYFILYNQNQLQNKIKQFQKYQICKIFVWLLTL